MTIKEVNERYNVPMEILREYESWGLCGAVHDIGFESSEVETYMKLLEQEGTESQRMRMLNQKRGSTLDEIHFREKQLERLDYLRHNIRKLQESSERAQ